MVADANVYISATGRTIPLSAVTFDRSTNRFYYGGILDVTSYLSIAQKRSFPGYDLSRANEEAYILNYRETHGGQNPPNTGSTSTTSLFLQNLSNEAFGKTGTVIANLKSIGSLAAVVLGLVVVLVVFKK